MDDEEDWEGLYDRDGDVAGVEAVYDAYDDHVQVKAPKPSRRSGRSSTTKQEKAVKQQQLQQQQQEQKLQKKLKHQELEQQQQEKKRQKQLQQQQLEQEQQERKLQKKQQRQQLAEQTGKQTRERKQQQQQRSTDQKYPQVNIPVHMQQAIKRAIRDTKAGMQRFSDILVQEEDRRRRLADISASSSNLLPTTTNTLGNRPLSPLPHVSTKDAFIAEDPTKDGQPTIDFAKYKSECLLDPIAIPMHRRMLTRFFKLFYDLPTPIINSIIEFADYDLGKSLLYLYAQVTSEPELMGDFDVSKVYSVKSSDRFCEKFIEPAFGFTLVGKSIKFSTMLSLFGHKDFSITDVEFDLAMSNKYRIHHFVYNGTVKEKNIHADVFYLTAISSKGNCLPIIPIFAPRRDQRGLSRRTKDDHKSDTVGRVVSTSKDDSHFSMYTTALRVSAVLCLYTVLDFDDDGKGGYGNEKIWDAVLFLDIDLLTVLEILIQDVVDDYELYAPAITQLYRAAESSKSLSLDEDPVDANNDDTPKEFSIVEKVNEVLEFGPNGGAPVDEQLTPGTVVNITITGLDSTSKNTTSRGIYQSTVRKDNDGVIAKLTNSKVGRVTSVVTKKIVKERVATELGDEKLTKRLVSSILLDESPSHDPKLLAKSKRIRQEFEALKQKSQYKAMLENRKKLPAWQLRRKVIETVAANQVTVIEGDTGCGKSTQVPQFILDHFIETNRGAECNILVTQPRRISAMGVAKRVSEERAEDESSSSNLVGFQIRFDSTVTRQTRLTFATTGVVLRKLQNTDVETLSSSGSLKKNNKNRTFEGVTHIIVDEVHERNLETDFLLLILKKMLAENPGLKVILMSATMNASLFQDYFGQSKGLPVPKLFIPGRTFPVDVMYLEDAIQEAGFVPEGKEYIRRQGPDSANVNAIRYAGDSPPRDVDLNFQMLLERYPNSSRDTVRALAVMDTEVIQYPLITQITELEVRKLLNDVQKSVKGSKKGKSNGSSSSTARAILIFLPGVAEIEQCLQLLFENKYICEATDKGKYLLPLHGSLIPEEQMRVFNRPVDGFVKIVVATNVAETSITIDDVVCVLDSCKMKDNRFDALNDLSILEECFISRANAIQRRGRAGRVRPGTCYHLVTRFTFENLFLPTQKPEILRTSLMHVLLRVKTTPMLHGRLAYVLSQMIDAPPNDSIVLAKFKLVTFKAMYQDESLTPLGIHLSILPVDIKIGKLLIYGAMFHCLGDILTIAATLNVRSPFYAPMSERDIARDAMLSFATAHSDHLTILTAYNEWQELRRSASYQEEREFCRKSYLARSRLDLISKTKLQLVEHLAEIGFFEVAENPTKKTGKNKKNPDYFEGNGDEQKDGDGSDVDDDEVIFDFEDSKPSKENGKKSSKKDTRTATTATLHQRDVKEAPKKVSRQTVRRRIEAAKRTKTGREDGVEQIVPPKYRERDGNIDVVKAVLVAALYPNVAVFNSSSGGRGKPTLTNLQRESVVIHPSTVNARDHNLHLESPFLIYQEIVKTSRTFIRDSCTVKPSVLMLFAEDYKWLANKNLFGSAIFDSMRFNCGENTAILFAEARSTMMDLLTAKLIDPTLEISDEPIIKAIVRLIAVV